MYRNDADDAVWRFDDGGLMAGPYSRRELEAFLASGYIQSDTEIVHESGQRLQAKQLMFFGETRPDEQREKAEPNMPRVEGTGPQLWNPSAAVNWSLLLTPAFGAYLHAANWRTLGKPKRAAANMLWVWITLAFLMLNLGLLFIPEWGWTEDVGRGVFGGILIGWYVSLGRSQAIYVKKELQNHYVKKAWGSRLLCGIAAMAGYLVFIFLITKVQVS